MLDIGWSEFLVIGVVALVVIGPRELPVALRTAGRYIGRARALARDFRDGLDDIARETEVSEFKNQISGGMGEIGKDWLDVDDARKPAPAARASATSAEADLVEADLDAADAEDVAGRTVEVDEAGLHDVAERAAAAEAGRTLGSGGAPPGKSGT